MSMAMDLEKLVQDISRLVLNELRQPQAQKTILLFARRNKDLPQALQWLKNKENCLAYVDDSWSVDQIDRFIFPCLSIDQMVDLAMGKGGSKLMSELRQVLLSGKKVEIAEFEYQQFEQSAPSALIQLYKKYHATLEEFGVRTLKTEREFSYRFTGSVVTEADIAQANNDGVSCLEISKRCCVTALAFDFAKQQSIEIQRITGGVR